MGYDWGDGRRNSQVAEKLVGHSTSFAFRPYKEGFERPSKKETAALRPVPLGNGSESRGFVFLVSNGAGDTL